MSKAGSFYLGALTAENAAGTIGERVELDAASLTTHGVIVGMTGSGKTGLGVVLLEEAARAGIPCIVIDPKGDMTNLMLNFVGGDAAQFAPWVDEAEATRQGFSTAQLGSAVHEKWRSGVNGAGFDWNDSSLQFGDRFRVVTPGSKRGVPVNLLGTLDCPRPERAPDELADEIDSIVSGFLSLLSIEADPLTSKPYILLAQIISQAWSNGVDLDLETLIGQVLDPPFRKLGVFQLDAFFPKDARTTLAMQLNNLLASPAFAAWSSGIPLDIDAWLDAKEPRSTIVYLSHLSETERQFVVALLLGKLVTWVRRQPGTTSLRALVYMDEVAGYVPPSAAPATKRPILTLLKQARAQGLGLVLATQNPVDLDYKALSNAGTWLIGRLQTPQDRQRLLKGIDADGVDSANLDAQIAKLAGRHFVLHRSGKGAARVLNTRFALSFLRGPLTLNEVEKLCTARGVIPSEAPKAQPKTETGVRVAPKTAAAIPVSYLRADVPWAKEIGADFQSSTLHPAIAVRVQLKFDETAADIDVDVEWEAVLFPLGAPPWDARSAVQVDYDDRDFTDKPPAKASYAEDAPVLATAAHFKRFETQLKDELLRTQVHQVKTCRELSLFARPGETDEQFTARCQSTGEERANDEAAKLHAKYEAKLAKLRSKAVSQEQKVAHLELEGRARVQNELIAGAASVLKLFFGGRGNVSSITGAVNRRNQTRTANQRLETARENQSGMATDVETLENELQTELSAIQARWQKAASEVSELGVRLEKTDIRISEVRLVWIPS